MFPYTQYTPTTGSERFCNQSVASPICGEFILPKKAVIDRHIGMPGASMPETAVDKDDNALFAKHKVGFSE